MQGTKAEDQHYHEVTLPGGELVPTGPPIGEPATDPAPDSASGAAPSAPDYPQDGKREYVRDDHGRFSSEGAGGAANDALDARGVALAVAGTKNPQEAAAGRQRLAGLVDRATSRARSTLGREHPATRTLSAISSRARTADARGLQSLAGELGRVNERLAEEAAAGKAAPGTKEDRVEPTDTDPDAEKATAAGAYATQDPANLPAYGREVYDRMHDTTFQMFGKADDPASERYASGVAWRAVAQAYGFASAPSGPAKAATLPQAAGMRPPVSGHGRFVSHPTRAKGIPWGGPVFSEGGFWIVPVSRSRGAENLYDRIDSRVIPDSGGAVVRVGIGRPNNHKQIIDVRVPKRMVDSTPGGSGAAGWVQWNMDIIRAIAQSDVSPGALIRQSVVKALAAPAEPAARLDVTGCKFVTSPEKAQERITYDVVYAPWEVDLQGQYATEEEVRKMAHEFIARKGGMNLMHITGLKMTDGRPAGEPVESFIARSGDPDFPRGAWVMGVKWHPEAWEQVKSGRLTGYSIEGQWGVVPLHLVPSAAEMGIA